MSQKLSIDSEVFDMLRNQFDTILNALVKQLGASDEGEINIKIKVDKSYSFEPDLSGEGEAETQKLDLSWDITRTVKAKKFKVSGRNMEEYFLEEDEDGAIKLKKLEQGSLFDKKVVEIRR